MMSPQEFDQLAERILLTILPQASMQLLGESEGPSALAEAAVDLADAFLNRCRQRHKDVRNIDGLTAEEVIYLETNNYIHCIKSVRERTGMGLKEAKMHVDKMRLQLSL